MGRASIRGESSTRDNMVNSLLFSCVLLIGVSNPFTVEAAQFAVDRYANDGSHVSTV